MKEFVKDKLGNEIYLTDERWKHICLHVEMEGYRDRVLEVLKKGQRKQAPRQPDRFKYSLEYDDLEIPNNRIVVVVFFGYNTDGSPNNYVMTAYQVDDYSR